MNKAAPLIERRLSAEYYKLVDQDKEIESKLVSTTLEKARKIDDEDLLFKLIETRMKIAEESKKCINEQLAKLLE